ncbi:DUF2634 domain-containing protein [Kineosporia rhizophila]|uniref:DUF2634 domain-containing protein n=1 Tax=Kineosporia rhizophila TaxID=84633 RepID=UPI000A47DEE7|nr:DUF2634 domain-containing protein [Kineosporia rhizophila]MCE0539714.1 DUF2634 domain-containing protein [Kineosporia rhizophila]
MSVQPGNRFGSSLRLEDGDLVLSGADLRPVHGDENLRQALTLRLLTPYGSDQVNATYGLDVTRAFTGNHGRRMVKELLRLEIVRTLASDPRVADVLSVVFDDEPGFPPERRNPVKDRLSQVAVSVRTAQDTTALILTDVEL